VHVQVYATDLDGTAIAHARAGRYPHDIEAHVSPERLARHFTRDDRGYQARAELRDMVVFAKHDLIADPPFTRLDVLCCRNVLIYLQPALQQRLFPQFHYALGPGGLLVLGASEAVPFSSADLFEPVDGSAKVFRRLDVARVAGPPFALAAARSGAAPVAIEHERAPQGLVEAARHAIVDAVAPPVVLINARGDVLYVSQRTGRYLEPAVGKTNINIFAMAREGLGAHLSLGVRQALARRRRVTLAGVEVRGDRARYLVDLTVVPLDTPVVLHGLLLVVFDEPPPGKLAGKAARRGRASGAASAERELVRVKQHLHTVAREMEASQAQVEAANEALQCANEELQSTNEEVTTSKEELQAMNEELLTLNAELEAKNAELGTANDDLRNLLNSTKIPTLFLDGALRLKRFTSEATRIANVQPGDVGRPITDLTLKIDYHDLARDVAEVLETLVVKEVAVARVDSASYTMRIHPYRTTQNALDGVVVTFFDTTELRRAEAVIAARAQDSVVAGLLDRWPGLVCVRDLVTARDVYLNDLARERLRTAGAAHARFESLLHPDDAAQSVQWEDRLARLPDGEVLTRQIRLRGHGGDYERFRDRESVLARAPTGAPLRVLAIIESIEDAAIRASVAARTTGGNGDGLV